MAILPVWGLNSPEKQGQGSRTKMKTVYSSRLTVIKQKGQGTRNKGQGKRFKEQGERGKVQRSNRIFLPLPPPKGDKSLINSQAVL
jgi:hypothetical protein